ncbi:uncharacterized protein N7498_006911 [Penicillium cinerascens]|uniref:Threonine/serine exporter-like N-terminal domain-containing protein n=1 Tax=Penicillium cinerascens TaxID=70096 RepID=A0A9W9JK31_9EURO|nr:uncharacterized protein N7498_006911 [Penicillium cinerascens]KAJ5197794.1 hypothetical protein N7498_006911 [Penicillium cinerascens]
MAGGYFHLPVSRRPASDNLGSSKTPPVSHSSPSTSLEDGSQGQQTYQELKLGGGAQGTHRNASILKNTNRVKFTTDELELKEPTGGHSGECRLDRRGTSVLPQRPLPTANIPRVQDWGTTDPQRGRSAEQRSSTASPDVTGLTIDVRSASSETGDYEISAVTNDKGRAISYVQGRAQRLASLLSSQKSPKPSPHSSLVSSTASTPIEALFPTEDGDEVPMINFPEKHQLFDELTLIDNEAGFINGRFTPRNYETQTTVRQMSRPDLHFLTRFRPPSPGLVSSRDTPSEDRDSLERPRHNRGGILSSILRLYDQQSGQSYYQGRYGESRRGSASTDYSGRGSSPDEDSVWKANRPKKWYEKSSSRSSTSLAGSSIKNPSPIGILKRSRSSNAVEGVARHFTRPQLEDEIRITVHIAELLQRQRYLIRLCRALMKYGAPTHRLEEYMRMTARVLEIDGQFLYIPGCMIISFDDASTHTTEVKVVRSSQGIDLGKLADVHEIYKEVIHDVIGVEEAIQRLDETMKRRSKYHILFLIFAHGCASASVGPFAFNARPVDMPVAFLLGCLLGVLQLILSPKSSLYSNVFEISAAVLTSFLARAFGSIRFQGESLFCFSALAQSSIALILPGYTVLCASLELQSRSIVAGSVRMVYAIIYSLFLGFGITIGTAVYGLLDPEASTAYTCPASPITNEYLQRFPFVLIFTACLAIVNHAKWKQIPIMLVISLAGYVVSYFSSKRFYSNTQVSNALGAFVIGVMGNCYSRLRHGLAAAAMLPAIFVLVPSGLAASGSLISGITSAEEMTRNPYAVVANGTQGFVDAAKNLSAAEARNQSYGVVFDIGYGMVQVAIGTTVGLFLAALVVYPLGKKRSGLFSF